MNPYSIDKQRFIDLFTKHTGVSKAKLKTYLKDNTIGSVFRHPHSLEITPTQLEIIKQLIELRSLYYNLKDYDKKYKFTSPKSVSEYFKNYLSGMTEKEVFACAFLDTQNGLISTEIISVGTINASLVVPRDIAKKAMFLDAAKLVVSHNHPSGDPTPSEEDINITHRIIKAFDILGITVLDHVIIGDDNFYSLRDKHKMMFNKCNEQRGRYKTHSNKINVKR